MRCRLLFLQHLAEQNVFFQAALQVLLFFPVQKKGKFHFLLQYFLSARYFEHCCRRCHCWHSCRRFLFARKFRLFRHFYQKKVFLPPLVQDFPCQGQLLPQFVLAWAVSVFFGQKDIFKGQQTRQQSQI